jgi:hypothetical protein
MTITTVPSGCTVTVTRRDPLREGVGFMFRYLLSGHLLTQVASVFSRSGRLARNGYVVRKRESHLPRDSGFFEYSGKLVSKLLHVFTEFHDGDDAL